MWRVGNAPSTLYEDNEEARALGWEKHSQDGALGIANHVQSTEAGRRARKQEQNVHWGFWQETVQLREVS